MDIILNDLSIHGQYDDVENFFDSITDSILPILKAMEELGAMLYKSESVYNCMITKDKSLSAVLCMKQKSFPEIERLKETIVQLAYDNPYWQSDCSYDRNNIYKYPYNLEEPNCFTVAMDRELGLLSFPQSKHSDNKFFDCEKNSKKCVVDNVTERDDYSLYVLRRNSDKLPRIIALSSFYGNRKISVTDDFCKSMSKISLTKDDNINIFMNINNMICGKAEGKKNRFWDTFEDDIYEYRLSISAGREYRVYFLWEREIVFLFALIKKSQKIGNEDKKHVLEISKRYKR